MDVPERGSPDTIVTTSEIISGYYTPKGRRMPRRPKLSAAAAFACLGLFGASMHARPVEDPPPGMAAYVMAFLKKGPAWTAADSPETAKLMAGHLAHLRALVVAGDLVAVGPLVDDGDLRGVLL